MDSQDADSLAELMNARADTLKGRACAAFLDAPALLADRVARLVLQPDRAPDDAAWPP
jgi:hypothetical protein